MKPDTTSAMYELIAQIRLALPSAMRGDQLCSDSCDGCSTKLLSFLETELDAWDQRLLEGVIPNFGDLNKLARSAKKVHRVLQRNGVLADSDT